MIDGPDPFDTLQTWEQHLAKLRQLPENVLGRDIMISYAERLIEQKRLRQLSK